MKIGGETEERDEEKRTENKRESTQQKVQKKRRATRVHVAEEQKQEGFLYCGRTRFNFKR